MVKKIFGRKKEKESIGIVQEGWQLRVTGEVGQVSKLDLDKSGKHPKFTVYLQINVISMNDGGFGVELDPVIQAQGKEKDILQQLGRLPDSGDQVIIQCSGYDKRPSRLGINQIEFAK